MTFLVIIIWLAGIMTYTPVAKPGTELYSKRQLNSRTGISIQPVTKCISDTEYLE